MFIRNNHCYTEQYYNWLLPYVKDIEKEISGFSKSWMSNRHNLDGQLGLVRAAKVIFTEKIKNNSSDNAVTPSVGEDT